MIPAANTKHRQQTQPWHRVVVERPFDRVLTMLTRALVQQHFRVTEPVDVSEDFRSGFGQGGLRRYALLGVVNRRLVFPALRTALDNGVYLATNIAVYELDSTHTIVIVAQPLGALMDDWLSREDRPDLTALAADAADTLFRALAELSQNTEQSTSEN